MLLDTGSDQSSIDESLNDTWGLNYTGGGWSKTVHSTRPYRSIEVMLTLDPDEAVKTFDPLTVTVRQGAFDGESFKGLLGRDVLDQLVLNYNGPAHRFTLSW
jgi:hypothetical protein